MELIYHFPFTENANDVVRGVILNNSNGVTFDDRGANFNGINQSLRQPALPIPITAANFPNGMVFEFEINANSDQRMNPTIFTTSASGVGSNDSFFCYEFALIGFIAGANSSVVVRTSPPELHTTLFFQSSYFPKDAYNRVYLKVTPDGRSAEFNGIVPTVQLSENSDLFRYTNIQKDGITFGFLSHLWQPHTRYFRGFIRNFKVYRVK